MAKKVKNNRLEVQNSVKTLYANIRFMSPDKPIRSIAVTSSVPAEGKTTTIVELAKAIAETEKSVLLVECDMRKRDLANMLQARGSSGMYAVMTEEVALEDAVVETSTPNLHFLDVEPNIPNPTDVISSASFSRLAAKLSSTYDYVLYDTPPVGTFVDAAILSTLVDGTILVVRMNSTKRSELLNAFEQLKKAGGNILGSVATCCEEMGSQYYYGYYESNTLPDHQIESRSTAQAGGSADSASSIESKSFTKADTKGSSAVARHSHEHVSGKLRG